MSTKNRKNKGKQPMEGLLSLPECPVCFTDIYGVGFKCSNNKCDKVLCEECTTLYFDYALKDKLIPKCTNCGVQLLYSDVSHCSTVLKLYNKCCISYVTIQHGEESRKEMEKKELIERLRKERHIFLESEFPAAIALTARIAMPNKLKSISKQKHIALNEAQDKSTRSCMNLMCRGSLNSDFICMTCSTAFCEKCEKRKKSGHQCNEKDVESIELIRNTVKCPKCKLPIEKASGCNYMTCANCKECFTYNDGKIASHGSVNRSITLREEYSMSTSHESKLKNDGLLDLVVKLELLKPNPPSVIPIQNLLIKMYKEELENDEKMAAQVARGYEKYIRIKELNTKYQNCLLETEDLILENKLTKDYLLCAIEVFNI